MKFLIRSKQTQRFLGRNGVWTAEIPAATDFRNIREVTAACQEFDLQGVELVLMIGNFPSEHDMVIPLPPDKLETPSMETRTSDTKPNQSTS